MRRVVRDRRRKDARDVRRLLRQRESARGVAVYLDSECRAAADLLKAAQHQLLLAAIGTPDADAARELRDDVMAFLQAVA